MGIVVPLPDPACLPVLLRDAPHWILWKAEERDGKIAKVPCNHAGQMASMKEGHRSFEETLIHAERIRAIRGDTFGVGLSFTDDLGIVGVDLDAALVDGVRADHLTWATDCHPTWGEFSLSGAGVHLFYAGKFEGKRNAVIDGSRFEIFGTKGFIAVTGRVLPGSLGELSPFGPIAETLGEYLTKEKKSVSVPEGTFAPRQSSAKASRAYGLAALAEQCKRVRDAPGGTLHYTLCSAAFKVGQLVPSYLEWDAAEDELYAATADAGGKDMGAARRTIQSQLEYGSNQPFHPKDQFELGVGADDGLDLSSFGKADSEETPVEPAHKIEDPGPFPPHLLVVPGLIASVMALTAQNCFVKQPVLALAGALALMAVLTGRKVRDKDDGRTNAYILSVAGSGEGKEAARKTNKQLLYEAGAGALLGGESWASGSGLVSALEKQPALLFQNDEIGRFLQTTGNATQSPHLFSIISILLKLYSSASGVYLGDAYADARQNSIVQPHCVVYGTTVPGSFYAALSQDSLMNGIMGRMLIFEVPEQQAEVQDPQTTEPSKELVELVRQWFQWKPCEGNLASANPAPFTVPCVPEADEQFRALRSYSRDQRAVMGDVFGSLWVRCVENARKLALLYACSEQFGVEAKITSQAASWACELTVYLVTRQCWAAKSYIARNMVESQSMAMERLIREAGPEGLSATDIYKRTRHLKARDRNEIIADLIECNLVKETRIPRNGRPRKIYVAI